MKIVVTIVLLAAVIWLATRFRAQASTAPQAEPAKAKPADPKEVYVGLRDSMLRGSRSKFNLAATSSPTEPWGVLMDWGVEKGTVTVVAVSDGSASVYFSSGGGYIGGGGQEAIRWAAKRAVEVAGDAQPLMKATATYPLPQRGGVIFYTLTDAGTFSAITTEQELHSTTHPLRRLGDAMQQVITQYRIWSEQNKRESK
jgi:hypothetical protein